MGRWGREGGRKEGSLELSAVKVLINKYKKVSTAFISYIVKISPVL